MKSSGVAARNLIGVPWQVAFALQNDGWFLRRDIIWHKPDPMPHGNVNAPGVDHEYVFMFAKSYPHYYGLDDVREPYKSAPYRRRRSDCFGKAMRLGIGWHGQGSPYIEQHPAGRNPRTVWTIPTAKDTSEHPAPFPVELARRCVLAGCPKDGVVLDCFSGNASTGVAALSSGRRYLGIELNPQYNQAATKRLDAVLRG
jgi:site-specific DNA-methyltransferase (adenine-specific)